MTRAENVGMEGHRQLCRDRGGHRDTVWGHPGGRLGTGTINDGAPAVSPGLTPWDGALLPNLLAGAQGQVLQMLSSRDPWVQW